MEKTEGRISGRGRKVNVYYPTMEGVRRAKEILRGLEGEEVTYEGRRVFFADLCNILQASPTKILLSLARGDVELLRAGASGEGFLDRERELSELLEWWRSVSPMLVLYGSKGVGKTTLVKRFLEKVGIEAYWIDVKPDATASDLIHETLGVREFSRSMEEHVQPFLNVVAETGLLVLDGYGEVSLDLADFVSLVLREVARRQSVKLLVIAHESTPAYCRFYALDDVRKGLVRELHLRGLDMEASRSLLGNDDINEEAMRRIYLLTRGCPLYLTLIREGSADELAKVSRFTKPEIRLLLFSGSMRK